MFSYRCGMYAGALVLALGTSSALAEEAYVAPATDFAKETVASWMADPSVVEAIKAQNQKNAGLAQGDIDNLDKAWRAEVDAASKPMIDGIVGNALSKYLAAKKAENPELVTEIFVMDNKGLNVGQSDVTSDYWQGDEAKWQKTFLAGADTIFVDEIEKDESTQMLQTQVSMTVKDPATNEVIGAVTVGVNVDAL